MRGSCKARQYSDQMECARCGHIWDINDSDPPECLTSKQIGNRAIASIRTYQAVASIPTSRPRFKGLRWFK